MHFGARVALAPPPPLPGRCGFNVFVGSFSDFPSFLPPSWNTLNEARRRCALNLVKLPVTLLEWWRAAAGGRRGSSRVSHQPVPTSLKD